MIRLMLNARKPYNYAFFDPKSRVHLTVTNPTGYANEVTPAIIRGLASSVIIDVDNVIDLKKGCLKSNSENKTPDVTDDINDMLGSNEQPTEDAEPEETSAPEPDVEDVNEEPGDQQETAPVDAPVEEEAKEEKPKKKSSKKKA